jgi:copper resistance protein B
MKTAAVLTALLAITATPALAQHPGHPMPMPAPKPAPTPPPSPSSDAAALAPTAVPPIGSPKEAPAADPDESGMAEMAGMDHGAAEEEVGNEPAPPPPTDHAADGVFDPAAMARARAQLQREHGGSVISKVMLSLGEYRVGDGENGYRWEGEAWVGGDLNRFVVKSEGEGGEDGIEAAEVQALYSRAVGPYFDLQAGLRQDLQSGPKRTFATVGFEGVAPHWFETSGALFLSSKGEILARLEGSYDLRLTQRWILQPRIEANLSGQDIPELALGSGVSNIELGLRLRYEIKREFAPYVGASFERKFGGTADYARAMGEDVDGASFVIGVRAWF